MTLADTLGPDWVKAMWEIALSPGETGAGYVYFIGDDDGVKIGFSHDPIRRLSMLRSLTRRPLELLSLRVGNTTLEGIYHMLFERDRTAGEWFRRTPEIEAEIARLQGADA